MVNCDLGGLGGSLAFMLTGNAHAAEDVVQAALVRAYRRCAVEHGLWAEPVVK